MIISFIIPVYNTEEYVERCIQSILTQKLNEADYEIIIVNDGSTDDSLDIIEKIAVNNQNIRIVNQQNKGLGAARNTGLRIASGKYIFFVDSDDYIISDTLNSLISFAKGKNFDIIGFDWKEFYPSGKIVGMRKNENLYNVVLSGASYMNGYNMKVSACTHLFSRLFLEKFSLSLPEGIYHEDELFLSKAFVYAEEVFFINTYIYAYIRRENSITSKKEISFLHKRINDSVFIIKELMIFKKTDNLTDFQKDGLKRRIDFLVVDMIVNLIRMKMDKKTIMDTMRELRDTKLFPLEKKFYSTKYYVFRMIFRNERVIVLAARKGIL